MGQAELLQMMAKLGDMLGFMFQYHIALKIRQQSLPGN